MGCVEFIYVGQRICRRKKNENTSFLQGVDVEKLGLDLTKEDANTTAESVDKFTEICRKIQETGDDE